MPPKLTRLDAHFKISKERYDLYASDKRTEFIIKHNVYYEGKLRDKKRIVLENEENPEEWKRYIIKNKPTCINEGNPVQDDIDGKTIDPPYYKITFDMTPRHKPKAPYTE